MKNTNWLPSFLVNTLIPVDIVDSYCSAEYTYTLILITTLDILGISVAIYQPQLFLKQQSWLTNRYTTSSDWRNSLVTVHSSILIFLNPHFLTYTVPPLLLSAHSTYNIPPLQHHTVFSKSPYINSRPTLAVQQYRGEQGLKFKGFKRGFSFKLYRNFLGWTKVFELLTSSDSDSLGYQSGDWKYIEGSEIL